MFATSAIRRLRASRRTGDHYPDRAGLGFRTRVGRNGSTSCRQRKRSSERSGASRREAEQATELVRLRERSEPLDWRLDQTTDSELVHGNAFHAELDNEEARERLFAALDAAERSDSHPALHRPSERLHRKTRREAHPTGKGGRRGSLHGRRSLLRRGGARPRESTHPIAATKRLTSRRWRSIPSR